MKNIPIRIRNIAMAMITIVLTTAFFASWTCFVEAAPAKENAVEIKIYDFEAIVHKDHTYHITETITVDAAGKMKEGFVFKIPEGNYRISNIDVQGCKFNVSSVGGNTDVKITSKGDLDAGEHTYKLTYKASVFADNDDKRDLFYLTALSNNINKPIKQANIRILLPKDFVWKDLQYFAGQFGTQDVSNRLAVKVEGDQVTLSGSMLPQNFGISLKAELPEDYWQGELDNSWSKKALAFVLAGTLLAVILMWIVGGRDYRVKGNLETHPIDGVSAFEAGYLLNGKVGASDVVTMMLHFAVKGCIKICEYSPKKYRLYCVKEPKNEERYVRTAYRNLFEGIYEGRPLEMVDIGVRMHHILHTAEENIKSGFAEQELRITTKLSLAFRLTAIILLSASLAAVHVACNINNYVNVEYAYVIIIFAVSVLSLALLSRSFDNRYRTNVFLHKFLLILSGVLFASLVIAESFAAYGTFGDIRIVIAIVGSLVPGAFFMCIMKARAKGNAKLVSRVLSLRSFIQHADKEELMNLTDEDENYYYSLLPYAYRFGCIERWAAKFKYIEIRSADWYELNIGNLRTVTDDCGSQNLSTEVLARNIADFGRTLENEYYTMIRRKRHE